MTASKRKNVHAWSNRTTAVDVVVERDPKLLRGQSDSTGHII
jgi:hypothetical protein